MDDISTSLKFALFKNFMMRNRLSLRLVDENEEVCKSLLFVSSWYNFSLLLKAFEELLLSDIKIRQNEIDYLTIVQYYHNNKLNTNAIKEKFDLFRYEQYNKGVKIDSIECKFNYRESFSYLNKVDKVLDQQTKEELIGTVKSIKDFDFITSWNIYKHRSIASIELFIHTGNDNSNSSNSSITQISLCSHEHKQKTCNFHKEVYNFINIIK